MLARGKGGWNRSAAARAYKNCSVSTSKFKFDRPESHFPPKIDQWRWMKATGATHIEGFWHRQCTEKREKGKRTPEPVASTANQRYSVELVPLIGYKPRLMGWTGWGSWDTIGFAGNRRVARGPKLVVRAATEASDICSKPKSFIWANGEVETAGSGCGRLTPENLRGISLTIEEVRRKLRKKKSGDDDG